MVIVFECEKERVGFEPVALGRLKRFKITVGQFYGISPGREGFERAEEQWKLGNVEPAVIDMVAGELTDAVEIAVGQQPAVNKRIQVDQVRVARERRETLIG